MTHDIINYYTHSFSENDRLKRELIEWTRTIDIFERFLPDAPSVVFDIGGGTGVYARWLLEQGYQVNLIELVPSHVDQARQQMSAVSEPSQWKAIVGDARNIDFPDETADIVLVMGPLYHFQNSEDRAKTLSEAIRLLKPGGYLFCTIISQFASLIDGFDSGFIRDSEFRRIVEVDLQTGCHSNQTGKPEYFTTAYFHHPDELKQEMGTAGFADIRLIGIEGLLWIGDSLSSFQSDPDLLRISLDFMRQIEHDQSIIGASPHIMGIGKKPNP